MQMSYDALIMIYAFFIFGLMLLVVSAKFLIKAADEIGTKLRLPPIVTGIFIVGIGTSLPELVTGIISVVNNKSEIISGNILGANLSNLLLILGATVLFNKNSIALSKRYHFIDLHYLLGTATLVLLFFYNGVITLGESLISLLTFLIYGVYLLKEGTAATEGEKTALTISTIPGSNTKLPGKSAKTSFFIIKILLITGGSLVGLYFGADITVNSISAIAISWGVSSSLIALTVLSIGTTLPELAATFFAVRKGKAEMAIGNIMGSCIFNGLAIPGITGLFGKIIVPPEIIAFSLPMFLGVSVFFYFMTADKKISVWEGLLFIVIYITFILKTANLI